MHTHPHPDPRDVRPHDPRDVRPHDPDTPRSGEEGSLVTEYGLLAVLGATITGLAIKWASGGAIWELFSAVLSRAKSIVGA